MAASYKQLFEQSLMCLAGLMFCYHLLYMHMLAGHQERTADEMGPLSNQQNPPYLHSAQAEQHVATRMPYIVRRAWARGVDWTQYLQDLDGGHNSSSSTSSSGPIAGTVR